MMRRAADAPCATWVTCDTKIRELEVVGREWITPKMLRIRFGGPNVEGFESHVPDEHVKLVFPDPDTGRTRPPTQDGDHLHWPRPFPPTREYTIRSFDRERGIVAIDFVVHEGGLASGWALGALVGDRLWIAGPRPGLVVPEAFGYHVLIGDETALPAIARWLEELPPTTRGVAAIEIPDADERQPLRTPDGFEVRWLDRAGAPAGGTERIRALIDGLRVPDDEHVYLFVAGEAGLIKPVRSWARANGFTKRNSSIAGYWRCGETNEVPTTSTGRLLARARRVLVPR